eukprot:scaffold14.g1169.t1
MASSLMHALSDYGLQSAQERERLVTKLLFHLTGAQMGDAGFDGLLADTLDALTHHQHLDTRPQDVDDTYARLGERLGELAAFGRARALALLASHLRRLPLASAQHDYAHRVLSLLYCLSGAAGGGLEGLVSGAPPSLLLERLERDAARAAGGEPTYLTDDDDGGSTGSSSWAEVPYSPDSELSEWSEAEEGEKERAAAAARGGERGAAAAALAAPAAAPGAAGAPASHVHVLPSWAAPRQAAAQQLRSPYQRDSLAVWLASKRSGGRPQAVLEPRLCFSEQELVQQARGCSLGGPGARPWLARRPATRQRVCLAMLKGVAAPGPAFELDAVRDTYRPAPGAHLASASHGALRALLGRLAELATTLRRVGAFVADVQRGGAGDTGGCEDAGCLRALPTVAAFAAAVGAALRSLQRQLLVLELAAGSGAPLTLLQLEQRAGGLAPQAALLLELAKACAWRHSAAQTAAELLSALHARLQLHVLLARSQGGVLSAMLLELFLASVRPYCKALNAWLFCGALDSSQEEFCVAASASVAVDSPAFWTNAYCLRVRSDGAPAVPSFLAPLADAILAAGKSALLLQAHSAWRRAAAAARVGPSRAVPALPLTPEAACEGSPSKRRLSELGALGFALAAAPAAALGYGAPPPTAPRPLETWGSADLRQLQRLAAPGGGEEAEEEAEHPPLYRMLVESLREQLEEAALLTESNQPAAPSQLLGAQPADAAAEAPAAPAAGHSERPAAERSGGEGHELLEDWLAATACSSARRLLAPPDELPPLPPIPAAPEVLPQAVVQPLPPISSSAEDACDGAAGGEHASSHPRSTIGDRMRAAAAARVLQAEAEPADQLPLLLVRPAALESLAEAGGEGEPRPPPEAWQPPASTRQGQADGSNAEACAAPDFESGAWAKWYARTAAALSCQLQLVGSSRAAMLPPSLRPATPPPRQRRLTSWGVPLTLPAFESGAGVACQLWQGPVPVAAAGSLAAPAPAPLPPRLLREAPPLQALLQRGLLRPVADAAEAAGGRLCAALLRQGLLAQLGALRETFMLGSPLLEPFVSMLLMRISSPRGMDGVSEFDLNAWLQDALAAGGRAGGLDIVAEVAAAAPAAQPPPPAAGPSVAGLARLRLRVQPAWPLSLLVSEEMLAQYNAVLVLLLQLRWVRQSLQSVRFAGWKEARRRAAAAAPAERQKQGGGGAARRQWARPDGLQHQMLHLTNSVLQYITDRVLAAGTWLEQAVADCRSLDEMHACRAKYQRAVARYCLLGREGVARLVHEALLKLLDGGLLYCSLQHQLGRLSVAMAAAAARATDGAAAASGAEDAAEGGGPPAVLAPLQSRLALAQRQAGVEQQLAVLAREYGSRQRLLLRVLAAKAAEAGSHADELRQLLGALDYNGWFAAQQ